MKRRTVQEVYYWGVALLGAAALAAVRPDWSREPMVLLTLVILFGLAEFFPTRVRVGAIAFSAPMAYAAFLLYGPAGAAWTSAVGTVLANLGRRRSWRVTLFNSTQFALASLSAGWIARLWAGAGNLGFWPLLLFLLLYFVTNNLIVDGLLLLRLKRYRFTDWMTKNRYEALSAFASFLYSALMLLLAPRGQGHDPLVLLFFFLPLVTMGGVTRLLTGVQRFADHMATLMQVSTLVTFQAGPQALETVLAHLDSFDDYRYAAIYLVDGEELALRSVRGIEPEEVTHRRIPLGEGLSGLAARNRQTAVAGEAHHDPRNRIGEGSKEHALTLAAFPLIGSGQVIGTLTIGKERAKALHPEDLRLLTIFANMVAAIVRQQSLVEERERLLLVQERNRLAREIHDGLAQSLAGTLIHLDRLERLMEGDRPGARRLLGTLRETVREILLEVRRSIYNLRPSPLGAQGLVETLRAEISRLKEKGLTGGADLRLEVRGEPRPLSALVEDEAFRIAQEGLTNALKHAGAGEIVVSLHYLEHELRLVLRDDGRGFHLAEAVRSAGFGLIGMNERAERLGATFEVESKPGSGTRIAVEVPLVGE